MSKKRTALAGRPGMEAGPSLSPEHIAKLASSALPADVMARLQWRSLQDGRLEIDYLKPDGQPETCADGEPFRRHRSTAADIANGAPKYVSPKANGCRLYHAHTAIAAGNYSDRLSDKHTAADHGRRAEGGSRQLLRPGTSDDRARWRRLVA